MDRGPPEPRTHQPGRARVRRRYGRRRGAGLAGDPPLRRPDGPLVTNARQLLRDPRASAGKPPVRAGRLRAGHVPWKSVRSGAAAAASRRARERQPPGVLDPHRGPPRGLGPQREAPVPMGRPLQRRGPPRDRTVPRLAPSFAASAGSRKVATGVSGAAPRRGRGERPVPPEPGRRRAPRSQTGGSGSGTR